MDAGNVSHDRAEFRVVSSFTLEALGLFVVIGDIESGHIVPGMSLMVPVGTKAVRGLPIRSVELAIPTNGTGPIGLTFASGQWTQLAGMGFAALAEGTVLDVTA